MKFGKSEIEETANQQAGEWAHFLGVKKFAWEPKKLSSGRKVWLEHYVQQFEYVEVSDYGPSFPVFLEGFGLRTYSMEEWDAEGYDQHEFIKTCPGLVLNILTLTNRFKLAKPPKSPRKNDITYNQGLDKITCEDLLKSLEDRE